MKLIFNDATDMPIQSYEKIGGAVRFLTIWKITRDTIILRYIRVEFMEL